MSEEENTQQQATPFFTGVADKTVQEYRTDSSDVIMNIRTAMTGMIHKGGKWIKVRERGVVCLKHWEDFSASIIAEVTKGMVLAQLHEEQVEKITEDFGTRTLAWLCSNCLFCPDCGFEGKYGTLSLLAFAITDQVYYNLCRAIGGKEAELLSTMQTVTTQEQFLRQKDESRGFFRRK